MKDQLSINLGIYVLNKELSGRLDCKNFDAIVKALKEYGEAFEEIDSKDIPGLGAFEGCRSIRGLFITNEGHINSHHVIKALETVLDNCPNITFLDDIATRIHDEGDHITVIATAKMGTFSCTISFLQLASLKIFHPIISCFYRLWMNPQLFATEPKNLVLYFPLEILLLRMR
jgi:hypothetical protein